MYSQRTRRIIFISIVVSVAVVACAVLAITLYVTTDLFKSNETLFYKYAVQTLESLKYVKNPQLAEIENLKNEKNYETSGSFSYTNTDLNANSTSANIKLQISENSVKQEAYGTLNLMNNTDSIFNIEYAKSNNIIALKSPEIVNAYLGVRNENLQELWEKLGVTNTLLLPNEIKEIKLDELLSITEEQKTYIKDTYLKILEQNIDKSKFTKEKGLSVSRDGENYSATAYHLSLTSEELKQVEIAILQKLKEDETTLNIIEEKMKMLGLDSLQANNLKVLIQNQINKINNGDASPNTTGINIMLYATNGRIITAEIIYENSIKCTIYGTSTEKESKRYILVENLNLDAKFQKIEINENEIRNTSESTYNAIININDNTQIKANLLNKGSATENKLRSTCEVEIEEQSKNQTIKYESEMNFNNNSAQNMVQLNKSNCGILNDYEENQLKSLLGVVIEKTKEVLNQKLQIIGFKVN